MHRNTPIGSQIRSRTESFAMELAELVRQAGLEPVEGALGAAAVARRVPRQARRVARAIASRLTVRKVARRAKRTSDEVLELATRVHAHVRANAGQSVEQIGKAMRIPTKVLQLPIAKLLQGKKLRSEGQRRGTRYFAGKGGARAARPARRARKTAGRKRAAKAKTPAATLKPVPRRKTRGAQAAKPATAPIAAAPAGAAATT